VLRPVRTAGGQRRYSEVDVQRVEWLRDRVRDGWRIGEAARVIDEATSLALDDPSDLRETLIAAIAENDPRAVSATLDQAFAVLALPQALAEVVTPALRWAGEAWHRGELSVAQEHAITAKVRAHLGRLISEGQGGVRGSAVLACAPGEHHDIGLLMLAVMLRADGWRVEFLGADTPVDAAVAFAERIGARMLCLSASRTESVAVLRDALPAVEPNGLIVIVVGGAAVTPEIARELEATYADGRLDVAVQRLRALAAR
jgi:methanogenic corrinoid protein MtbC1